MDKPQIIIHATKSLNITLYDVKWIPRSARFVVLGCHPRQTGALQVFEMDQGEPKLIHEVEKKEAFKCGTFGAASLKQRDLATGDFNGNMRIWNLEKLEKPVYSVAAHNEIINCIDGVGGLGIGEGAPEIATGSRDGAVKIWDPRQKDKPVACMEPADGESKRDCWTVALGHAHNDEDRCVAAGYDNGDIKLFDLRNMSLRWETNIRNGICGLEFDRKDIDMNKLVATTLEAKYHLFDMRTQHPKSGFESLSEKAHKSTVWCARHLPQNRDVFMTCGGSGTLNLWKYEYPTSRVQEDSNGVKTGVMGSVSMLQSVGISSQPVAGFDWSPDKAGLCVCSSFDQCIRVLIVTKLATL
nr:dynein axonemal assembly factor 10-like [Lytechinus pictus]